MRKRCPAHPGRILKNLYLEPLGLSNTKLAEILSVSRNAVSNIECAQIGHPGNVSSPFKSISKHNP